MKDAIEKQKNEIISVSITGNMTLDEFAEKVSKIVYAPADNDVDAAFFIALLDRKFENLDIAIELANHFTYVVNETIKEDPEFEWEKYTPKINCPKDILNLDFNKAK